jgi:hypothetical protein
MALEDEMAAEFGGPGPEDFANAAAALAAGLVREAQALSAAAAALRTALAPAGAIGEALGDVRRQRAVLGAAGEAATRAALALDAAATIGEAQPAAGHAARMAEAARRVGLPPTTLLPLLRAAALDFRTDDAAARIAATTLAAELCAALGRDGG